jgi:hypothetical protein
MLVNARLTGHLCASLKYLLARLVSRVQVSKAVLKEEHQSSFFLAVLFVDCGLVQ